MNREMALGMITGIIVGIIFVALVMWRKRVRFGKETGQYDERQELLRGRAYKLAFFTMIIYFIVSSIFTLLTDIQWADPVVEDFIGFFIGITVFVCVSIMKDAYLGLHENAKSTFLILGGIMIINAIPAIQNLNRCMEHGQLTYRSLNLCSVLAFASILITLFVKIYRDKKAGEDE